MKAVTLRRSTRLIVPLLIFCSSTALSQASITQILSNGPSGNRINVVFLSEGYTASQLSQFLGTDAYTMMNSFLGNSPFTGYSSYFNMYAISVASNQSGSDHPSRGAT